MKKHIRKAVAIAAVAVIPLAGLAACSSGGTGSDKVTITFANADTSATWGDAVKGFEKANPDITVKQLNIPYAQYVATINQRMGQGGGGIDVMVVDAGGALADFASRGYLADLSDLKQSAVAAAVSEDMVTARENKGKLYALEPWTTSQFLYFNKDLLAKAGVQEPSTDPAQPWTYEQLTEAAKKVKAADAAPYPFLFDQWDSYYQLQMVGVSAGGGNGISDSGKVDFANAGWQKALTWYHDLFTEGVSPRGITNDKNGPLFQTGKAAFMISGPWGVSVAAQGKIDFGIAPAPYFDGGKQATSTDSWGVAVSAKSKQAAAAKKFLQYLTIDATGNTQSAQVANITPTNKDSYTGYATKANATAGASSANFGDVMQYQLQHNAVHRPNVLGYSVFEPGANQMFADIRNGADPKNAAKKADDELTAQIARLK